MLAMGSCRVTPGRFPSDRERPDAGNPRGLVDLRPSLGSVVSLRCTFTRSPQLGSCQRAQETTAIVGERVKLKSDCVGGERPART